jgi:trehalose 6-phosphate phosphatase
MTDLPHAKTRLLGWIRGWRGSGRLVLLLDFDGTLAPIVDRPELAAMHPRSRLAIERLLARDDVEVAIVSGRGLADARALARLEKILYAGNHGMEIEGPDVRQVHPEAAAARPVLEAVASRLRQRLADVDGAIVEDKGLTLSVHYRLVTEDGRFRVRQEVEAATAGEERIRVTEGKMVLEIRPRVDWHKGRAVEFILDRLRPPGDAPVLYVGDDRTDEDAFRALARSGWRRAEGVLVAEAPVAETAARARVRSPEEVADLLQALADAAPAPAGK